MQLSNPVVFLLLLSWYLWDVESEAVTSILTVTNGGKWGKWGGGSICPKGMAKGFSLKIHYQQGHLSDDSSLNGIRLICTDGSIITSTVGQYGVWSDAILCPSGYLTSFSLEVSQPQWIGDDTAADNIKFMCTDGTELKGNGPTWGAYGPWSESCKEGGICGIQTKVERAKGLSKMDNTGLNDVKFFCCI